MIKFEPNKIPTISAKLYNALGVLVDVDLVVDTGSGHGIILDEKIATFLGYDLSEVQEKAEIRNTSGDVTSKDIHIAKIETLGIEQLIPVVRFIKTPPNMKRQGFIGVKFLRDMKICFDFKNGTINLENN